MAAKPRTFVYRGRAGDDSMTMGIAQQARLRRFLEAGYSARWIAEIMRLPIDVVGHIKTRGPW